MKVSVITPNFNMAEWLKLCVASVNDQEGVEVEHIIQDAESTDDPYDWLSRYPNVKYVREKDEGMYDALNRAIARSTGDIVCHINGDEQYLPGILKSVVDYFERNKAVDMVLADIIVTNPDGSPVCIQKVVKPTRRLIMLSHMPTYTAGTFIRKSAIEKYELKFRLEYKAIADLYWMLDVLEQKVPCSVLRRFTTVTAMTGENMHRRKIQIDETEALFKKAGQLGPLLKPAVKAYYRFRKLLGGCYYCPVLSYDIYTGGDLSARKRFVKNWPAPVWMDAWLFKRKYVKI